MQYDALSQCRACTVDEEIGHPLLYMHKKLMTEWQEFPIALPYFLPINPWIQHRWLSELHMVDESMSSIVSWFMHSPFLIEIYCPRTIGLMKKVNLFQVLSNLAIGCSETCVVLLIAFECGFE